MREFAPGSLFSSIRFAAVLIALFLLTGCTAPRGGRGGTGGDVSLRVLPSPRAEAIRESLYLQYGEWKGTVYRHGGLSKIGIDCSGFVQITFRDRFGVDLPRSTKDQARKGKKVSRNSLTPGDLVFFRTGLSSRHVGIYIGHGSFLHVSTKSGVTVSSLDGSYWKNKYRLARRILPPS